jgi:Ala-tRNA(Pro) deacylase
MTCLDRLEGFLRENHVPFQMQQHHKAFTAQQVASSEHLPGKMMVKVVMAVADGRLVMLAIPAVDRVDVAEVAAGLGAKEVRLAEEREFATVFADCEVGAMPPFGNLYGIPVYVDRALARDAFIVFQAGTHTETISMQYDDYAWLVKPTVTNLTFRTHQVPIA